MITQNDTMWRGTAVQQSHSTHCMLVEQWHADLLRSLWNQVTAVAFLMVSNMHSLELGRSGLCSDKVDEFTGIGSSLP